MSLYGSLQNKFPDINTGSFRVDNHRDRSSGWKHAKLSGHSNESLAKERLDSDSLYGFNLLSRMGYPTEAIARTSVGGLHEKNTPSVYGKTTKSKTDLKIYCTSGRQINISIKKSLSGQVYFVRAGLFIDVYEKQFGTSIPSKVKRAIKLFWSAADDALEIINKYANHTDAQNFALQARHKSLNASTLRNYDIDLYNALLDWLKDNIYNLSKLAFAMGAVRQRDEWSEFVWYVNFLGEHNVDEIFPIEKICNASMKVAENEVYYGDKNGGTTIHLPFGFVQWHQKQMQFHHDFNKINDLLR